MGRLFPLWVLLAVFQFAGDVVAQEAVDPLWNAFKTRFISSDGRVIDSGNGGISHSEGQGYGMLLAVCAGDETAFRILWNWSRKNLQTRGDALFAWQWTPAAGVTDKNNASDGDLLIAWALGLAGRKWKDDVLVKQAQQIGAAIRSGLIRPSPFGRILLPGELGFERPEGLVVNLSYWVFPALQAMSEVDPSVEWEALQQSGGKLIATARFSKFQLPPDWLLIRRDGSLAVAPGFDPVYGYNAVRIPLHLAWARQDKGSLAPFVAFAAQYPSLAQAPASVNLESGAPGEWKALPGMQAIYRLAGAIQQDGELLMAPYPQIADDEAYFSVALGLLADAAAAQLRDSGR